MGFACALPRPSAAFCPSALSCAACARAALCLLLLDCAAWSRIKQCQMKLNQLCCAAELSQEVTTVESRELCALNDKIAVDAELMEVNGCLLTWLGGINDC